MKLILTCEHGGNQIPQAFQLYFENFDSVLQTHRGYDLGALDLFKYLKSLAFYSLYSQTSRLLVELNRSTHHKSLFSEVSKQFSAEQKKQILAQYYFNYRTKVQEVIQKEIGKKETVLHISVHSFTPFLNNKKRKCDIGILYDSRKKEEQVFAKQLKSKISQLNPDLNVRFNYPYLGKMDGFTTYLRKQYRTNYLGIELEINQKFANNNVLNQDLKNCLFRAIANCR